MELTAKQKEIKGWLEDAQARGATHLIIAVDTFANEDFPVCVMADEELLPVMRKYSSAADMLRVLEVYDLSRDLEAQLREPRAWHTGKPHAVKLPSPAEVEAACTVIETTMRSLAVSMGASLQLIISRDKTSCVNPWTMRWLEGPSLLSVIKELQESVAKEKPQFR